MSDRKKPVSGSNVKNKKKIEIISCAIIGHIFQDINKRKLILNDQVVFNL